MRQRTGDIFKIKGAKAPAPIKYVGAGLLLLGGYAIYKKFAPTQRIQVVTSKKSQSKVPKLVRVCDFDPGNIWNEECWETQQVPFDEGKVVAKIKYLLTGAVTTDVYNIEAYEMLMPFTLNDLRIIHNAWLKKIDNRESLYDWIYAEWSNAGKEKNLQYAVLEKLNRAGVGSRNQLKLPKSEWLLK